MEKGGWKYQDIFASDIDETARLVLKHNFSSFKGPAGRATLYLDCTKRSAADEAETVDLYTAGFPCQPYSKQGNGKGARDKRGKPVVKGVLDYIKRKRPVSFVLENVPGLVESHREFFDDILQKLRLIKAADGTDHYEIDWEILNSQDFGLPQSRRRVIIVGITKEKQVEPFTWPSAHADTSKLNSVLEPKVPRQKAILPSSKTALANYITCVEKIKARGGTVGKDEPWIGDLGASAAYGPALSYDVCPCILRSRSGGNNYYHFGRGRFGSDGSSDGSGGGYVVAVVGVVIILMLVAVAAVADFKKTTH